MLTLSHAIAVTDFNKYPYPCLGRFAFLELSISLSPKYPEILQRIKNGDKYLDIGCCVGQDIRKLASDGAPSENMYGSDLQQEFMDIGYDLFLDKSTLKSTFIAADILNPESGLKQLEGQIDIIHAASFFHLFDWDESVTAMKQAVRLLKAKPGSMLVGRQIGNAEAGARAGSRTNKQRYRHNQESFEKMWKQVGEETGTNWNVDARLSSEDLFKLGLAAGVKADFIPPDTRWLSFTVTRV